MRLFKKILGCFILANVIQLIIFTNFIVRDECNMMSYAASWIITLVFIIAVVAIVSSIQLIFE